MSFPALLPGRPSATRAAEEAIRAAILDGERAPGARLPPERILSARLGVSRLTLRAALASLAAAGLVSVRHGSGYSVRDFRESGGPDLLPGLLQLVADRAALRRVASDLLRLRRHLAAAVLEANGRRAPPTSTALPPPSTGSLP
jgi:DNA-binding FadR family transcriptional regulator